MVMERGGEENQEIGWGCDGNWYEKEGCKWIGRGR